METSHTLWPPLSTSSLWLTFSLKFRCRCNCRCLCPTSPSSRCQSSSQSPILRIVGTTRWFTTRISWMNSTRCSSWCSKTSKRFQSKWAVNRTKISSSSALQCSLILCKWLRYSRLRATRRLSSSNSRWCPSSKPTSNPPNKFKTMCQLISNLCKDNISWTSKAVAGSNISWLIRLINKMLSYSMQMETFYSKGTLNSTPDKAVQTKDNIKAKIEISVHPWAKNCLLSSNLESLSIW